MNPSGRLLSVASIGLMSLLAAGFGLWSAFTGPKIAVVQLRDAAANTANAANFEVTLQIRQTPPSSQSSPSTETIVYQAPNRVYISDKADVGGITQAEAETQIGSSCWTTPPTQSAFGTCNSKSIGDFLQLVKVLETASGVTLSNGTYSLSRAAADRYLVKGLGTSSIANSTQDRIQVKIRLRGDSIHTIDLTIQNLSGGATAPGLDFLITFPFVGTAAPVATPTGAPTSTG
jgi:hypothetical protein